MSQALRQHIEKITPLSDAIAYYVSPLASATNGAAIRVEGGLVRSIL